MKFDLGIETTPEENVNSEKDNVKKEENLQNKLNKFFSELINSKHFKIKINEKLLREFENFIENKFTKIIMDDKIFSIEEQPEIIRWLDSQKYVLMDLINKPYLNNKLIIAVTGRFAAGKSSFLNTILNTNLPVDVEATTAIPTYLTYYKELHQGISQWFKTDSNYMLVNSIFGNKIMETKFLDEITKENVKDFPIPINQLINFFVLSIKNSILKNKVIIDTPGIDPSDKKGFDYDEKITSEALSLANVVFWVMDIDDGDLSNISIRFLEKNINEEQDLVIIVNKIDKKPPKEIDKVINKVKQTIQKYNIKAKTIDVLPFSKKDKKLIKNIISFINSIPIEKTSPFIIEFIEFYLKNARDKVVDRLITTKNFINSLEDEINIFEEMGSTSDEEKFYEQLDILVQRYNNNENMVNTLRNIEINYNNITKTFSDILDMLHYDSALFGKDKYYFTTDNYQTFVDKLIDLITNSDLLSKEIWHIVGYYNCLKYQNKLELEQLEELEAFINNAINEFENLQNKLKTMI